VKWWLLAIPHYIVVGIFLGGSGYAGFEGDLWGWWGWWAYQTGLIGLLVLFAGVALLFLSHYPAGIFGFVMGMDRWTARVAAYVLLMRDEYPPFRLDQGGNDPSSAPAGPDDASGAVAVTAVAEAPVPAPAEAPSRGWSAGRVALVVVGVVAALMAFGLLAGGCALTAIDRTQRDDDGFLMSPSQEFQTATFAIVSERADLHTEGAEWALDTFLGDVRIRSESERPVFVGIGPAADVTRYLAGVEHDVVTDLDSDGDPEYTPRPGRAPPGPPASQTFWVASASGSGEQTLDWDPRDGDWRAVVMNVDGSRGVSSDLSIGAELDSVLWIGLGMLGVGLLFAVGAALAITGAVHRSRPSTQ
jgi:hypothetical protein